MSPRSPSGSSEIVPNLPQRLSLTVHSYFVDFVSLFLKRIVSTFAVIFYINLREQPQNYHEQLSFGKNDEWFRLGGM